MNREQIYYQIKHNVTTALLNKQRTEIFGMLEYAIAANDTKDAFDVINEMFEVAIRKANIAAIKNTDKVYYEQKEKEQQEKTQTSEKFTRIGIDEKGNTFIDEII